MEILEKERTIWDLFFEYRGYVLLFLGGCLVASLATSLYLKNVAVKGKTEDKVEEFVAGGGSTTGGVVRGNYDQLGVKPATQQNNTKAQTLFAEISGAVKNPSVYEATEGARIADLILLSGGYSSNADLSWISRNLNLAEKLVDQMKVYIPSKGELVSTQPVPTPTQTPEKKADEGLINVNKATLAELDSLPGIGPAYGQRIIDNRPYKNFDELVANSQVGKGVLDKIKQQITY